MIIGLACIVLLGGGPAGPAPSTDMAARLIGLWGSEQVLGPRVHGTLIIRRTGWGWTAEIAGRKTAVRIAGDSVTLSLPGGEGELRATLSPDRRRIAGQWIQPVPSGNILRYTSFVSLTAAPASGGPAREWRGVVQPLEDRLSLYLLVDRQPDSSLTALLRNPDGKQRDAQLRVALDGAQLRLTDLRDSTRQLEGAYDSSADVVTLHLPDLGTAAVLTRRDRTHAAGFYPHPPAPARYTYRRPADDGDGWPVAIAADAGMDAAPLAALVQRLWDVDPAARDAPLVHSVLVARHGKLVLEEYFFGFDRERPHDLRSASKTFASVLLGAAMEHGARVSPEDRVYALMPEYAATADADPRKRDMTVEHLMTMTSGLPCDENGDQTLPGNEDAMQSDTTQLDWYRYMLDLPLAHAPGTFVGYCSGGVNLVGGIVRRVTGTWLPALFQRDIAEPLGFRDYHLDLTPTGEFYLGGGAYLRPRDLLKLGQVYLDGGAWRGRRIVSRAWVERSTTCQVYVASRCADGYDWHLNEIRAGDRVYREYEANGNGGQFLIVLPELDLAVVFTAGNYRRYGIWRTFRDELVPLYIIAAVKPSAAR